MRGTSIYINEDLSDLVRQRRREQLPQLKEERQKGNFAFFMYDKLIVHLPRERQQSTATSQEITSAFHSTINPLSLPQLQNL